MARPTKFKKGPMTDAERQRRRRKRLERAKRLAEPDAKKEHRARREAELGARIAAKPDGRFGVILADPAWRFEPHSRETGLSRAADNHYLTEPTAAIAAWDVPSIAAKDSVLAMYATAPMLLDALAVMAAWGFTYKTHAIWFKQRIGDGRGSGYWFLGEHELLLIGTRGNPVAPAMGTQARSVFIAPVGRHSEKPEVVRDWIDKHWPNTPKVELNCRGAPRPGWDAWGNEAEVDEAAE